MNSFAIFCKLIPYLACLVYGAYSILEIFFPSLRDPDFNRWEIDEGSGTTIQIMGWKKMLGPQGYWQADIFPNVPLALWLLVSERF